MKALYFFHPYQWKYCQLFKFVCVSDCVVVSFDTANFISLVTTDVGCCGCYCVCGVDMCSHVWMWAHKSIVYHCVCGSQRQPQASVLSSHCVWGGGLCCVGLLSAADILMQDQWDYRCTWLCLAHMGSGHSNWGPQWTHWASPARFENV